MYGGIREVSCKPEGWELGKGGEEMLQGRVGRRTGYTGLVVIAANCIGAELGASSRKAGLSHTWRELAWRCMSYHVNKY